MLREDVRAPLVTLAAAAGAVAGRRRGRPGRRRGRRPRTARRCRSSPASRRGVPRSNRGIPHTGAGNTGRPPSKVAIPAYRSERRTRGGEMCPRGGRSARRSRTPSCSERKTWAPRGSLFRLPQAAPGILTAGAPEAEVNSSFIRVQMWRGERPELSIERFFHGQKITAGVRTAERDHAWKLPKPAR